MNTKVTICVGLNDKDSKHQEITTDAAKALIFQNVVNYFGFGTISDASGVYTHGDDSGAVVIETTVKIEITFFDTDKTAAVALVRPFVLDIKKALNQETIYADFVACDAILF